MCSEHRENSINYVNRNGMRTLVSHYGSPQNQRGSFGQAKVIWEDKLTSLTLCTVSICTEKCHKTTGERYFGELEMKAWREKSNPDCTQARNSFAHF